MSSIPKACYKQPQGELCTPEEFLRRAGNNYKVHNIYPYCPECDEKLVISSQSVTNKLTHYRHYPLSNSEEVNLLSTCSLRNKTSNRQGWYCDNFNFSQVGKLINKFLNKDNLLDSFFFCWKLCGTKNLDLTDFGEILDLAIKKKVWAYAALELWQIPYIFLTLRDFTYQDRFYFHFILHKQKDNNLSISSIFNTPTELQKVFTDSGTLMSKSPNNPLPVSKDAFEKMVENNPFKQLNGFSEKLFSLADQKLGALRSHL
ncbi:hypothetical protein [Pasteurella multocida]|uniref:hypothetical protein n=1 Tax=Pasteurella multocida TaxID=747 RepID=UPI0030D2C810